MGVCVSNNRDSDIATPRGGSNTNMDRSLHDGNTDDDQDVLERTNSFVGIAPDFEPGENVGDKYEVATRIGEGTLGSSYSAHGSTLTDTNYVFKVVPFALRPDVLADVRHGQKQLIKLQHANVLPVLDVMEDTEGDTMIIVSPLAARGNVLPLCGKLLPCPRSDSQITAIVRDIGVALRVLHSHNVYHFNLHPGNIFQLKTGCYAVGEAGFHHLFLGRPPQTLAKFHRQGLLPPEVLDPSFGDINPAKVDIWGFGVFLYQLAFGEHPFDWGTSLQETITNICNQRVRIPVSESDLPPDFVEVLQWMLEKKPDERPSVVRLLRHPFFRCGVSSQSFLKFNSGNALNAGRSTHAGPGRFEIEKVLGKGPHAETMLVLMPQNGRNCVLKIYEGSVDHRIRALSTEEQRDARKLIAISKKITMKNVAPYLEVVCTDKQEAFATLDYFHFGDVAVAFPGSEATGPNVVNMLSDVLCACAELQCQGVYHGNLKPSNVFRNGDYFAVADFGPIVRLPNEFFSADGATCAVDVPDAVQERILTEEGGIDLIDAFAVGLLAASVNSNIRSVVWDRFYRLSPERLNIDLIVQTIEDQQEMLPPHYADFVRVALTECPTPNDLLRHPLINFTHIVPMQIDIDEKEIRNAIRPRFSHDVEESRITDIIGASAFISSPGMSYIDGGGRSASAVSIESSCDDPEDQPVTHEFEDILRCGLCRTELKVALFKCNICPNYLRCGKCKAIDDHGHELVAMIITSVKLLDEDDMDSRRKMSVLVPTDKFTKTGIEEVEMAADLPTGSLLPAMTPKNKPLSGNRLQSLRGKASLMPQKGGAMLGQQPNGKKLLSEAEAMGDFTAEDVIQDTVHNKGTEMLLNDFDLEILPPKLLDPPILYLRHLDLSNNKLRLLNSDISFLSALEKLVLGNNLLEELPEALGNLEELRHLDVSHNLLKDLPPTLMFAENLDSIAMDYNKCEEIPGVILDMAWMSTVYLAENHAIKTLPSVHDLQKLGVCKIGLDNEPCLWEEYKKISTQIPRITIMWNKVYPDPIVPGVYCGSLRSAQSLHVYERLGIGYLLTVGRGLEPIVPSGMKHKVVIVDDIEGATIDNSFEEAIAFIEAAQREESGCLVHCFAGMSRSATTVIAYLMKKRGMRLDEAYCTTKKGRPAIYPNAGFFNQLLKYDSTLFPDQRALDIPSMERDKVPMA